MLLSQPEETAMISKITTSERICLTAGSDYMILLVFLDSTDGKKKKKIIPSFPINECNSGH